MLCEILEDKQMYRGIFLGSEILSSQMSLGLCQVDKKPTSAHSFLANEILCSHNTWVWVFMETISTTLYWEQPERPLMGKLWTEVWRICPTNSSDKSYFF